MKLNKDQFSWRGKDEKLVPVGEVQYHPPEDCQEAVVVNSQLLLTVVGEHRQDLLQTSVVKGKIPRNDWVREVLSNVGTKG